MTEFRTEFISVNVFSDVNTFNKFTMIDRSVLIEITLINVDKIMVFIKDFIHLDTIIINIIVSIKFSSDIVDFITIPDPFTTVS